ncbi:hypothetical protein SAMN05216360_104133 [Methylobacterium phyllostachyos]|uniref:Alpha/beta hydrolase family protein n=1 Tax=Methylobacterium phyllostachyos TaxID=582672 RepID=A0A1G9WVX9_9HYPH|nr:hypothetical protein [Methylobacterium phyllostachyos]SDM88235.1 hypothetical protein SAMN05216360_104133 [Methylobacterium phyllostachyos]
MPPTTAPPAVEAQIIEIEDGERLRDRWRPQAPDCGIVVSFHGFGSRPEPHAARFCADPWRAAGWARSLQALAAAVAVAGAPRGLYLDAPFDVMAHPVRLHVPLAPSWLLRDTYRSDLRIRSGTASVLIVQGRDDPVVPAKLALALAAVVGLKARIELVPGDHVSILGSRDREAAAWFGVRGGAGCLPQVQRKGGLRKECARGRTAVPALEG